MRYRKVIATALSFLCPPRRANERSQLAGFTQRAFVAITVRQNIATLSRRLVSFHSRSTL